MRKVRRLLHQSGFHVFTFYVFLLVLVWPILAIPGHQDLATFSRYLFWAWFVMIAVLYLLARSLGSGRSERGGDDDGGQNLV
jgi:hypothetical protein